MLADVLLAIDFISYNVDYHTYIIPHFQENKMTNDEVLEEMKRKASKYVVQKQLEKEEKPLQVPGKYVRDLVEAANNVVFEFVRASGNASQALVSVEKLEALKKACEALPL
jgi:hypothetical protein